MPVGRGGLNVIWNKVPACWACNQEKEDGWPTCSCPTCRNAVAAHWALGVARDFAAPGWEGIGPGSGP